jgi:uncharacterized protein (TIGR03437 family)
MLTSSDAQTLTALASFDGGDSSFPSSLIQGMDGNFYGTTSGAGKFGGTVFKVTPAGTLTTLYTFPPIPSGGSDLKSGVIQASDGNLYGTTYGGGPSGDGTIFRITTAGVFMTLYNLNRYDDGANPYAGLIQASDGNLYGTTGSGGPNGVYANGYFFGYGTVFKITLAGVFTPLHSFSIDDGVSPYGGLVQASDGNFYGTTLDGGATHQGTIFRMTPAGLFTVIYGFIGTQGLNNVPGFALIQGVDGNLYGINSNGGGGFESVYKITPEGVFTAPYNFNANIPDGLTLNTLVQGTDGNFYGTASTGGANGYGTIFRITPGGTFTTIYSFDGTDGKYPQTALVQGTDGNFYGTTSNGGASLNGTVFRLQPAASAGYECTNTTPPAITFIDSASAYGGYSYFASGSWLEIKGTNLADPADPRLTGPNPGQWTLSDFDGIYAPTSLDGVRVSVNGLPAYVWYLSPTQLNVQAPEDSTFGNVAVTVTNCYATSPPFMFTRQVLAPGFLSLSADGTPYMVATFASDGAYVLNTSAGAALGLNSRPAKPGDLIISYGIGFGEADNLTPAGGVIAPPNSFLQNAVMISFGSTNATVTYSGLATGFVGLYEFYFMVPPGLANGDYQIHATQYYSAAQQVLSIPQTLYLTVHN